MRTRTYVVERCVLGQQFTKIGATDSREHAEIIAEAAFEVIGLGVVLTLCNEHVINRKERV